MQAEFRNFLRKLMIYTILISVVAIITFLLMPPSGRTPALAFIIGFLFLSTLASYHLMMKAAVKRPAAFINTYMALNMLKLLLYIIVLLGYALLVNRHDAVNFTITFFVFYILFTVFEIYHLQRGLSSRR